MVIHRHTKWRKLRVTRRAHPQLRSNKVTLCFLVSPYTVNKHPPSPRLSHLVPRFPHFGQRFHCLKRPPRAVLKCPLVFLSARRLGCALWRKISSLQAQVTVLLAMNSMLMNQQHILNKVSLNRNRPKTRLCIDRLK